MGETRYTRLQLKRNIRRRFRVETPYMQTNKANLKMTIYDEMKKKIEKIDMLLGEVDHLTLNDKFEPALFESDISSDLCQLQTEVNVIWYKLDRVPKQKE